MYALQNLKLDMPHFLSTNHFQSYSSLIYIIRIFTNLDHIFDNFFKKFSLEHIIQDNYNILYSKHSFFCKSSIFITYYYVQSKINNEYLNIFLFPNIDPKSSLAYR